jgi:hypothetical protein
MGTTFRTTVRPVYISLPAIICTVSGTEIGYGIDCQVKEEKKVKLSL